MQKISHVWFLLILGSLSFWTAENLLGDERPGDGGDIVHPIEKDLRPFVGFIIDSIEIDNREIFDTSEDPYDNFIFRTANKLHVKTRKDVISRELLFEKGERFSVEFAKETTRNLRNRYTIYDSWVEIDKLSDSSILVRVVTIDEWSFAGGFEVSREGNEYRYEISFEERN
jgi:hypothetical protein